MSNEPELSGHDPIAAASHMVSVIVPARNEAGFIDAFCASALGQKLPPEWSLEVLIADGMSDDGTREALARIALEDPRVRWFDNPQRIVSAGLNRAIGMSQGEVIVRMDVHSTYADDYIAACLAAIESTGADNVGGPWRARGAGITQEAIAAMFQSRWLAGGARSRQLDFDGWVDTVYLGCWPRAAFERFGNFDESLVRNQDDEHNLRITLGGGRIWQSASIESSYRPRDSIAALFRQYMQYGYWKPWIMKKHGQPAALRHLVPGLFVLALMLGMSATLLGASAAFFIVPAVAYIVANVGVSIGLAMKTRVALLARLPFVIAAYHFAYGIGSLLGWADVLTGRQAGRTRFASLTR